MDWSSITIGQALRRSAAAYPDRVALVGVGERITFADFDRRVDEFADGLAGLGVGRGDNVAIWMANCPAWTMAYVACARIGAVVVPINTRFRREEAEYVLRQADAKALVAMDRLWGIDYEATIREMAPELGATAAGETASPYLPALRSVILWTDEPRPGCFTLRQVREGGRALGRIREREAAVTPDDPVIIVYTSGTTGHPKGAVHSHAMLRNAENVVRLMHIEPGDVILAHMPFYHIAGAFTSTLPALMLGCTLVTVPHWQPDEVLNLIGRERVTIFGGIPTHYIDCLDAIRRRPRDTSCLKSAWIGGAPVTPDVARAALSELKLDALQAIYGMTETTAVTNASEFEAPLAVVCDNKGRAIGDFEVKVCDPATGASRPNGEPGEIWVRGHVVMLGYYKNPAATAEVMTPDGWFKTGDLGAFDEGGYLKITGRVKDMFIVGGSNAYPAEIERMLQAHPDIKQAVVVGVPDRRLGEVGYAFLQLDEGAACTPDQIVAYCRATMADYKVPRHIAVVSEFPRTATGKIQRFVLAEQARAAAAQPPS